MSDYKWHETPLGDVIGCDSCGCEVPLSDFRQMDEVRYFCEVCSNTMISRAVEAPRAFSELYRELAPEMARVANHVLSKMGAFPRPETKPAPEGADS